jgi:long-chain acyl-CoA synthetase
MYLSESKMKSLENYTLRSIFNRSAELYGDKPALSFVDGETYSYGSLKKQVDEVSAFLHEQGVYPGDRVAILGENSPHWGIAYFSITTMGAITVPVLPDFHESEIHHILRHSGAKVLFVSERYYHKVEDFDREKLSTVILLENFSIINPDLTKDRLSELLEDGSRELTRIKHLALKFVGVVPDTVQEDDIAAIIYTSGTMGNSKGVMLPHKNLVKNALATLDMVPVKHTDRFLSILPLAHVYEGTLGLIAPIIAGASVHYIAKPPTAAVLLPALSKVKPTVMLSVPLIIEKMFKMRILPKIQAKKIVRALYKLSAVRKKIHKTAGKKLMETFGGELHLFCIGGASIAPEVELFMREAGFPYAIGYGLTETSPLVTGTYTDQTRYRSAGKPLKGVEVKIDSPDTKTGEGEVLVRSDMVMRGYYNNDEATHEVMTEDGWFRTGDLGYLDDDQYLYIKGRLKNVILGPSGENIYPESIELVINRSDIVLESLVFQQNGKLAARIHLNYELLDEEFTERKMSERDVREEINKRLEDIKKYVNENVSLFSRLSTVIEQTEPFEKTPTQKIKRYLYT